MKHTIKFIEHNMIPIEGTQTTMVNVSVPKSIKGLHELLGLIEYSIKTNNLTILIVIARKYKWNRKVQQ